MAKIVALPQRQPLITPAASFSHPHFSPLPSSFSDFSGARISTSIQNKRKAWQPKQGLRVTASATKRILIMGGTRFRRLLVKDGHQVIPTLLRGKALITQQLPGESDQDYPDFSSKVLHLKGDRKDFDFVRSSLSAEGFDVVYDIYA